ncbi:MAG: PD-(D/E)XK nuclease family protein [Halothiobacillaceae bacterium]
MGEQNILAALRAGAELVTVNNRLARHWRAAFAKAAAQENRVWATPSIVPWGAWLRQLWADASWLAPDAPMLLEPMQASLLWQKVVERDIQGGHASPLLQSRASAKLAQDAWRLLHDWRLSLPFDAGDCSEDVLRFQHWTEQFAQECNQHNWLDEAGLSARLLSAWQRGQVRLPARVLFLGFEDWTPAQQALLDGLRARGCEMDDLSHSSRAQPPLPNPPPQGGRELKPQAVRVALTDAAAEDEAAARWARAFLEAEPDARLAIVAPDLRDRRARLARLLDAQLAPQRLLPAGVAQGAEAASPWNMSLGAALSEHGMVQAALLVFALGDTRLDLALLGQALRSPFLGGYASEREARAMLDERLRKQGELSMSEAFVRRLALEHACPEFARIVEDLVQSRKAQTNRLSPSDWVDVLREELKIAAWPGDAVLASSDFQLRQTFLDGLQSLARLELVQAKMRRDEVLAHLRALAAETLFQPEAVADAPVQVLGPLEALGQAFDGVWLLGMQHEQWPEHAKPNPFLPMRLQADLAMPHASPARELDYARRISDKLLELAGSHGQIIVSHALAADGRELEPSPLFEHLPQVDLSMLPQADVPLPAAWGAPQAMEWLTDTPVPPLPWGAQVSGGARVLELQSACAFRAFAELRLAANALEEPDLGPDARERGNLVHAVMEALWGELGNQAALLSLDDASLQALVLRHVQAVVDELARRHASVWPTRLQALEVARLTELVLAWLALERERSPFTIEAREQKQVIEIGGLQLNVKVDRIDCLANNKRLVMDYKTGTAKPAQWAGERPEAPQLPLYAVSLEHVSALAFAQMQAGDLAFAGLADAQGADTGLTQAQQDWSEVLAEYRRVLEALAEDFRTGRAEVNPRKPNVCTYCPLTMLCRIHEQAGEGFALALAAD